MEPTLTVEIGNSDNEKSYQIIRFIGEFDKAGYMEVHQEINDIVEKFQLKTLVFDFTSLKFINSESIGYLVEVHSTLSKTDKVLVLVGADAHVKDVLKTIGISEIIPIHETFKDSLNAA